MHFAPITPKRTALRTRQLAGPTQRATGSAVQQIAIRCSLAFFGFFALVWQGSSAHAFPIVLSLTARYEPRLLNVSVLADLSVQPNAARKLEPTTFERGNLETYRARHLLRAQRLVRLALTAHDLENDATLSSMRTRARLTGLLPELRARVIRSDHSRDSFDYGEDIPLSRGSNVASYAFEGRATFKLDRLLFADEELTIERLRAERREARERITRKVMDAYFRLERAELDLAQLPGEREAELRKLEAEVELNTLTAGAFLRDESLRR
jgi:hypothetical protein